MPSLWIFIFVTLALPRVSKGAFFKDLLEPRLSLVRKLMHSFSNDALRVRGLPERSFSDSLSKNMDIDELLVIVAGGSILNVLL